MSELSCSFRRHMGERGREHGVAPACRRTSAPAYRRTGVPAYLRTGVPDFLRTSKLAWSYPDHLPCGCNDNCKLPLQNRNINGRTGWWWTRGAAAAMLQIDLFALCSCVEIRPPFVCVETRPAFFLCGERRAPRRLPVVMPKATPGRPAAFGLTATSGKRRHPLCVYVRRCG